MIYVGLDDTDTLTTPGTNQLARHIVRELAGTARGRLITRHQLLEDPRVPCTRRNGCAAIEFDSCEPELIYEPIRRRMLDWCPAGSDPGLCIAKSPVSERVIEFGRQCQRRLVRQSEARQLAAEEGVLLEGLGGTQDGVIGALAAVGLINSRNDGRVIFLGSAAVDHFEIGHIHEATELLRCGVDEVRCLATNDLVMTGAVDVGKRLRPNYRLGKVVLYVLPSCDPACDWLAQRVV